MTESTALVFVPVCLVQISNEKEIESESVGLGLCVVENPPVHLSVTLD